MLLTKTGTFPWVVDLADQGQHVGVVHWSCWVQSDDGRPYLDDITVTEVEVLVGGQYVNIISSLPYFGPNGLAVIREEAWSRFAEKCRRAPEIDVAKPGAKRPIREAWVRFSAWVSIHFGRDLEVQK